MSFLSSFNISASGMTAQRMRLDIVSENITNMQTTRTADGTPYRRKMVTLEAVQDTQSFEDMLKGKISSENTAGVRLTAITEDQSELPLVYDPTHPDANEEGYVAMPNVSIVKETTDAMAATRAYEANITAFNALKTMAQKALEIGK